MSTQIWWYTARAGGIVAWALAGASVVCGLVLSSRVLAKRFTEEALVDLHRFLGALAVSFAGVHVVGLLADRQVDLAGALVPGLASDRPGSVAWGVVALYLLVAVQLTSLVRTRIGERAWRVVHYAGFAVFVFGSIHGLRIGTDVENPVIWWPAAALTAAVVGLVVARIITNGDPVPPRAHPVAAEEPVAAPPPEPVDVALFGSPALTVPPPFTSASSGTPGPATTADRPVEAPPAPVTPGAFAPAPLEPVAPELRTRPAAEPMTPPTVSQPSPYLDDRPDAGILERTLARLRELDETWPAEPLGAPLDPPGVPAPLPPGAEVSGSLFPTPDELRAEPGPLDLSVPSAFVPPPAAHDPVEVPPTDGTAPRPAPTREPVPAVAGDLPVRIPRRLARTTVAATSLDDWTPNRTAPIVASGPPEPPTAVDPVTGEPDPVAYRKWLREWLAYVESQA